MFTDATYTFLAELADNNDRDWFNANKQRYEDTVREPARAFVRAVGERLPEVSEHFVANDKKVGGSLMRIYRDTRFSKDKTPYKTNIGIHFRHAAGKNVHAPGLYVHLEPGETFIGCGLWRPDKEPLKAIRDRIASEGEVFTAILEDPAFTAVYGGLHGDDALKRVPRGYPKDHPMSEHLKRKSFVAMSTLTVEATVGDGFVDDVMDRFARAAPFAQFLCEAVGQPF